MHSISLASRPLVEKFIKKQQLCIKGKKASILLHRIPWAATTMTAEALEHSGTDFARLHQLIAYTPRRKQNVNQCIKDCELFETRTCLIFVGKDFDASLALGHAVLLLLSELGGRQLGLLLGRVNLVAHGIKSFLLLAVFLQTRSSALTLDPIVARWSHPAVHDSPDLR